MFIREDFISFLWKYRLFTHKELSTTEGLPLEIVNTGMANQDAGPDFSAARIRIDNTLWVGNVEIHVKSSDWYKHKHQIDNAYQNVILHVVLEHDQEITDEKSGKNIPVFEIRNFFDATLYYQYERMIASQTWIPCEKYIGKVDNFLIMNWLSRLLVERLESKAAEVLQFYQYFENNWEQTFFYFMARNFGFKINAAPFGLMAQNTPYKILAKHRDDLLLLEAMLFGQAGMLNNSFNDAYPTLLKKEYEFLSHKYQLKPIDAELWKFARLRPANFPTIRIAQFARLIANRPNLFNSISTDMGVDEIVDLFKTQSSAYWEDHYRFGKRSPRRLKTMGEDAIENVIINTIAPVKFVYGSTTHQPEIREQALNLLTSLKAEKNNIIKQFDSLGIKSQNAADSQAVIQLKKYYCTPKKCLECAIGHNLVSNPEKS